MRGREKGSRQAFGGDSINHAKGLAMNHPKGAYETYLGRGSIYHLKGDGAIKPVKGVCQYTVRVRSIPHWKGVAMDHGMGGDKPF